MIVTDAGRSHCALCSSCLPFCFSHEIELGGGVLGEEPPMRRIELDVHLRPSLHFASLQSEQQQNSQLVQAQNTHFFPTTGTYNSHKVIKITSFCRWLKFFKGKETVASLN